MALNELYIQLLQLAVSQLLEYILHSKDIVWQMLMTVCILV